MTSKIRHDVKPRHDIQKFIMTSKIRKKYVMAFDLFPEYFLTAIDPQLTKCDIGLWTHIYAQNTHTDRHTNTSFSIVSLARLKTDTHTNASITITSLY